MIPFCFGISFVFALMRCGIGPTLSLTKSRKPKCCALWWRHYFVWVTSKATTTESRSALVRICVRVCGTYWTAPQHPCTTVPVSVANVLLHSTAVCYHMCGLGKFKAHHPSPIHLDGRTRMEVTRYIWRWRTHCALLCLCWERFSAQVVVKQRQMIWMLAYNNSTFAVLFSCTACFCTHPCFSFNRLPFMRIFFIQTHWKNDVCRRTFTHWKKRMSALCVVIK